MIRALQIAAVALTAVMLAGAFGFLLVEKSWTTKEPATPHEYFLYGSTGTELMPLVVFQILPDLFPDQFQPEGTDKGDWIDQFGFVRGEAGVNDGLPLGINVSNYRPLSGAPSPIPFIGFNCAACHTARIRRSVDDQGVVVHGMANASIDLVAFGDAIKTSLLDEKRLTVEAILATHQAKYHESIGFFDRFMISYWLKETRKALYASLPLRGWPYGGRNLRQAEFFNAGPGRNQPMRETVRFLINQTPNPDGGSSKIPCLYYQDHRKWAQFDGSVNDPILRNSLAALGVGASVQNLRTPGILNTLRQSYEYIKDLDGPKYSEVFKPQNVTIDTGRVQRGAAVYQQFCFSCHGSPGAKPGTWLHGPRLGQVIPYQEVGTDSARVSFRFYPQMAGLIYGFFPAGHPLKPQQSDLRPNPGDTIGFSSSPLESLFSRAPYFHNGSVASLAELINLKSRRPLLYRGTNLYEPVDVGLVVPDQPDSKHYFRYDTQAYGNSNKGHDYPWPYKGPGWDQAKLTDLLEYLKTI